MVNDNRKRVGILFSFFREEWAGGFQFLVNLINSFNYLEEDSKKPFFYVFYNERSESWLPQITYPYKQEVYLFNYKSNLKTTVISLIKNKNLYVQDIIEEYQLDYLYPVNDYVGKINNPRGVKMAAWIPDFQHKFYPQYFSFTSRTLREKRFDFLLNRATDLVQSSDDVVSHLYKFYKTPNSLKVHVLKFVSNIDGFNADFEYLKGKYKIDRPYFLVSNQFFKHKNHIVVFEAINKIKLKHPEVLIVFTGRQDDYRNPDYIKSLHLFINEHKLDPYIKLLGLIPRNDQLGLMKQSLAVIQPSKFEGWSTVIEDAKSLSKEVIASDIPVHHEQLAESGNYFETSNSIQLANHLVSFLENKKEAKDLYQNYESRVREFAQQFLKIIFKD